MTIGFKLLVLTVALSANLNTSRGAVQGADRANTALNSVLLYPENLIPPLRDGESPSDRLFSTPNWKDDMAANIASLTDASRVAPEELDSYYRVESADGRWPNQKTGTPTEADFGSAGRVAGAQNPRMELGSLLGKIAKLPDRRVVPLVAPLLRETTPVIGGDDYMLSSPQERSTEVLRAMARRGIIEKTLAREHNLDVWRKWWQENRANFDPVPEALRAIDAGQGSAASKPSAPAPPPAGATPQPAQSKSESSPVPQPTVSKTEQKQWGLSAVILVVLALAIWAFAKKREAL